MVLRISAPFCNFDGSHVDSYECNVTSLHRDFQSGFCGLVVSTLTSGTQDRGFEPSRIFREKKSTACLPSEGKSHVADLRHVKEPCDLHGSRNHRPN
jgi:hypothetical protein